MTCCSRMHLAGGPCDRESLILPMLGMYFDVCVKNAMHSDKEKPAAVANVMGLIEKQKDRVFPAVFDYILPNGKVARRTLFGDSIARVDALLKKKEDAMISRHESSLTLGKKMSSSKSAHAAHQAGNESIVVPTESIRDIVLARHFIHEEPLLSI